MFGGKPAVAILFNDEQCEPDIIDSGRHELRCQRAIDSSNCVIMSVLIMPIFEFGYLEQDNLTLLLTYASRFIRHQGSGNTHNLMRKCIGL